MSSFLVYVQAREIVFTESKGSFEKSYFSGSGIKDMTVSAYGAATRAINRGKSANPTNDV